MNPAKNERLAAVPKVLEFGPNRIRVEGSLSAAFSSTPAAVAIGLGSSPMGGMKEVIRASWPAIAAATLSTSRTFAVFHATLPGSAGIFEGLLVNAVTL